MVEEIDLVLPLLIQRRAEQTPGEPFILETDGRTCDYNGLHLQAIRWAHAFTALGVQRGEVVTTMLSPGVDAVSAWLGASWAGAVECGLNTQYRGRVLEHALHVACSRVLVVDSAYLEQITNADDLGLLEHLVVIDPPPGLETVGSAKIRDARELIRSMDADSSPRKGPRLWDLSSVIFTSGTTGPAKGVKVPWPQLYSTATGVFPRDLVKQGDVFYAPFPMNHIAARSFIHSAALCAGSVVTRKSFSPSAFWSDIQAFNCTVTTLLGAKILLETAPDDIDKTFPLRLACFGPVIPEWRTFSERFGVHLTTALGGTEVCVPIAGDATDKLGCGRLRSGYPGVEVRLVDANDQEVPAGEVGELIIRTSEPWAMNAGYLGNAEATCESWRNGWYHTGDAVRRDEDGEYFFVDRMTDTIRRRAENISSVEVEAFVNEHPDVAESAAVGVPSDWGDEDVKICIVLHPGAALDPRDLIAFLANRMPKYMVPRYVEVLDEMPRTAATQRIQKAVLRERGISESTWERQSPSTASATP